MDMNEDPNVGRGLRGERRAERRFALDTSAVIHLVHGGSKLAGHMMNLSLGGCRIHTDERFLVGIYTRVEAEFSADGMAFRLGGVIQAIHERQEVGVRFLDVSKRKREHLEQWMGEMEAIEAGRGGSQP